MLLQIDGFRGGQVRFVVLHAGVNLDGGENAAAFAAEFVQNIFNEVGGGGFALGAGETDNAQVLPGMSVEDHGNQRHGFADVGDLHKRSVHVLVAALRQISACALVQRILQVLLLEGHALADEEGVLLHIGGVVGKIGEFVVIEFSRAAEVRQKSRLFQFIHDLMNGNFGFNVHIWVPPFCQR